MKTTIATVVATLLVSFGATSSASADARKNRTYTVKFKEVANTCEGSGTGISLSKAEMTVKAIGKKRGIEVAIQMIPPMKGRAGKKGKFSARAKKGPSGITGLDGKFSISGQISDAGELELIFFAEYYKGKTPLCTTSWKGAGSTKKKSSRSTLLVPTAVGLPTLPAALELARRFATF